MCRPYLSLGPTSGTCVLRRELHIRAIHEARTQLTARRRHFWGCPQSLWPDIQRIFISIKPNCGITILPKRSTLETWL